MHDPGKFLNRLWRRVGGSGERGVMGEVCAVFGGCLGLVGSGEKG